MNLFTIQQKNEIRDLLQVYVDKMGSPVKAANSLTNVSASTVRTVLKGGDYPNVSDEMWRTIKSQVEITPADNDPKNAIVETTAVKDLLFCMNINRENKDFIWAIADAGSGKTTSTKIMRQQKNVFYVLCDEDMKKSDFAIELARAVGFRVNTQKKARTIIMDVIKYLRELDDVLIIFDEGDKLSDNILYYFITIYNYLEGLAAVQFISTSYMIKRMENGLRYNKKGYQEFWSRQGSKFYIVDKNTPYDVVLLSQARGLTAQKDIDIVIKEAEAYNLDMRRAERKIKSILSKQMHGRSGSQNN